jgi:RecB family exonuclease
VTQPFFEAVCARAVAEAEAAGEIAPYGIIADRPGLPRAVARTVSEVLAARLGAAQLPSGLARLASGSLALLEQQGAILQPALFDLASQALEAKAHLPPILFLDPPASSLCERTFLVSVLRVCPDAAVTVPSQDTVLRRELELTAGSEIEDTGPEAEDGLSFLQRFLFAEVSPQPAPADDSVVLFSAPGEGRECVEIVRRIQQAASSGTPYDRMAVFLRSEESHRGPLEEALQRGCVPAHFASGSSVPDTSARAFLVLLACSDEGLSVRRFGEYLSLRQLGSAVNHQVWEQLLIEARAISGMARIERRLALLSSAHHPEQLALLRERGLALFAALEALPDADSWGGWADRLTDLARLGLAEPSSVSAALRELRAMDSLRQPALAELRLFLARRLGERRIAPPHRVHGAVFVGNTSEARGRSFERVFVPGLSEGVFPMKVVEDPMLLDAVRAQLSSDLETNRSRGADERLALQLAASAAEQQLVLSWSRINAVAGRPRVPSFYALEVLRASRGMLPSFESLAREADRVGSARLAWPAPEDPWVAIDEAEHDLALFARVRRRPESEARGTMSYLLGANVHLGRSLRARARRWNLGTYSSADGLLQPRAQGLAAIAEHGLSKRSYSATALQTFASCPYRFLLHTVHGLRKRQEPEAIEYVDRRTRGALIHSIQFALLTELRDTGFLPLSQARLKEATVILDTRIDAAAAQSFEELAPAIERVWQDAVAGIRADLREWLRRIATEQRWVPHRFELSFGLLGEGGRDEASQTEPVALDCGLSLRGSIDLVERDSSGRLRLTDYKSGSADVTQGAVVLGGRSLQPVLYALAAEKLFPGAVAEAGRLDYCTTKGQFREVIVPLDEEGRRDIESLARVLSSCLDRGAFLASPREGVCGGCDYRSVCGPHEEVRIRRKSTVAIEDLIKLRGLP